jgi:2,3-dihydroxybenzoate-AMP ligase
MSAAYLDGCTPWPDDAAAYYRAMGYWRGQSLGAMLRERAAAQPERVALVCGERHWTYRELDERCDRMAAGLARIGIAAQDRVVLQLPNVAEFFVSCFALFRLGAVPILALPAHRRSEIAYFCQLAEAKAYFIADRDNGFDYRTLAREVLAEAPSRHRRCAGIHRL